MGQYHTPLQYFGFFATKMLQCPSSLPPPLLKKCYLAPSFRIQHPSSKTKKVQCSCGDIIPNLCVQPFSSSCVPYSYWFKTNVNKDQRRCMLGQRFCNVGGTSSPNYLGSLAGLKCSSMSFVYSSTLCCWYLSLHTPPLVLISDIFFIPHFTTGYKNIKNWCFTNSKIHKDKM